MRVPSTAHFLATLLLIQGCHLTFATFEYRDPSDAGADANSPTDAGDQDASSDSGLDAGCASRCMGMCIDLSSDPERCGSCGRACTAPDNGTATCTDAACGFECDPGYARVLGTCVERDAPRPIAPLSTSTVTSRRPTLRWELAARSDGARIELCEDRACTSVLQTLDAPGTSARPPADLPAGVVFWRMFALASGVASPTPSVTWQFHVGARSADGDADTSWGTRLDVNGDGFTDVAVGARMDRTPGQADVYLGHASGLTETPATTLVGTDDSQGSFGSVASAGDINGDGFADLVVGAYFVNIGEGRVYVYYGGASGLTETPATVLIGLDGINSQFGNSVAGVGDLNGDGYADLVVGASVVNMNEGRAYIYLGGPSGLVETPTVLVGPYGIGSQFGRLVAGAGDVNGDGFADLIVGAPAANSDEGRAYLYLGGVGISATPATILVGPDGMNGRFGGSVASAGDVNGDGFADVVVGAFRVNSSEGRAYLYLGGASGVFATPATVLVGLDGMGGSFGGATSAGDVNGDGFADLVVGAPGVNSNEGRAYLYVGGTGGLSEIVATTLVGSDGADGWFGVVSVNDVNEDGFADLVVGAPGADTSRGRAYVYLGGTGGLSMTAVTTLRPDGDGVGFFGASITGG